MDSEEPTPGDRGEGLAATSALRFGMKDTFAGAAGIAEMSKALSGIQSSITAAAMAPALEGLAATSALRFGMKDTFAGAAGIAEIAKTISDMQSNSALAASLGILDERSGPGALSVGRELSGAERHAIAIWAATMALSLSTWFYLAHRDAAGEAFNWATIIGWAYGIYRLALRTARGSGDQM